MKKIFIKTFIGVILLSILAFIGVAVSWWFLIKEPSTGVGPTISKIVFTPRVRGCAETNKGVAPTGPKAIEKTPRIKVDKIEGNRLIYSSAIHHLCCREVELQKEIQGSSINIFEVWHGPGCKCMCFSEIEAAVSNIPSGSYTVNVYEKGTELDGTTPMEQKLIIAQEIKIPTAEPTEFIVIGGIRGDFTYPGPAEVTCQRWLQLFIEGDEFKDKGYSACELVESKIGDRDDCAKYGFDSSPNGCDICKIECK